MCVIVTGGAGFIGVNLINKLLSEGEKVVVLDNFSNSSKAHIQDFLLHPRFFLKEVNLSVFDNYLSAVEEFRGDISGIWHLAANSDIQYGADNPNIDLCDTFLTTFNTLEIIKLFSIKNLFFASSSAIYGDHGSKLITEESGPLLPISYYGAMKLASEAIISAATEKFLERAYIYRFPNVIGVPATHGVILDLVRKLNDNPFRLDVLGNGSQEKSYLHVSDLISAMFFINKLCTQKINIFNIGSFDYSTKVSSIAEEIVRIVSPAANIIYGESEKGWVGDVPIVNYSSEKIQTLGWTPNLTSAEAVSLSINQIILQENLLK